MSEMQEKWRDVISRVEGLGLKLKLHHEQEQNDANEDAKPGDTKATVDELGHKVQETFASMGNAIKDPAVKSDLKDIGLSLKNAMVQTVSTVGSQVEGVVKKSSNNSEDADAASNATSNHATPNHATPDHATSDHAASDQTASNIVDTPDEE